MNENITPEEPMEVDQDISATKPDNISNDKPNSNKNFESVFDKLLEKDPNSQKSLKENLVFEEKTVENNLEKEDNNINKFTSNKHNEVELSPKDSVLKINKTKKVSVVDSGSEDGENDKEIEENKFQDLNENENIFKESNNIINKPKKLPIADRDSEEEENDKKIEENNEQDLNINKNILDESNNKINKPKKLAIVDSDSENEENNKKIEENMKQEMNEKNTIFNKSNNKINKYKKLAIVDSDLEDEENDKKIEENWVERQHLNMNENILKESNNKINKPKKLAIVDSDSEEETNQKNKYSINENEEDDEFFTKSDSKNTKKRFTLIDSDNENSNEPKINSRNNGNSDNEDNSIDKNINKNFSSENQESSIAKKKTRIKLYDSDSSDDEIIQKHNDNKKNDKNELIFESEQNTIQKSRLSALCDSESSADEQELNKENEPNNYESHGNNYENNEDVKLPKYSKNNKVEKPKKMTGKEAAEQRREIASESQRMLRETVVSLPYHRAKSHTLQEFMTKRSRLPDIAKLAHSRPTHMSIKMSTKQLELAAKQLEEREKELDQFYKSDNESEEENENIEEIEANKKENEDQAQTESEFHENETVENSEKMETDQVETEKSSITEEITEDNIPENNAINNEIDEMQIEKFGELDENEFLGEKEINKIVDWSVDKEAGCTAAELLNLIEDDNDKENNMNKINKTDTKKKLENFETEEKLIEKKPNRILERLRKLNPLLAMKTDFKPRITGSPKDVIILDDDVEKSRGITELKKRFIAHNSMKPVHTKDESHIMSVDLNVLKHESAKVLIDRDDETRVVELKPGTKFKKLRQELEVQMAKKRLEQWEKVQREIEEQKLEDGIYVGEKDDCGAVINEEEEEEMTESESSDDDEDEVIEKENPRVKSAFVDDEADESDQEGNEADDESNEDDEDKDDDEEDKNDDDDLGSLIGNDDDKLDNPDLKKTLKRIINAFSDDSDDENSRNSLKHRPSSAATESIVNDLEENLIPTDDEDIPLYQKENLDKTPCRTNQNKMELNLTPTLRLTALEGMSSTSKRSLYVSPGISLSLPLEPSPLRKNPGLKTKLFESADNDGLTQAFDDLEALCSGKFIESSTDQNIGLNTQAENELLGVISGKFDTDVHKHSTESNTHSDALQIISVEEGKKDNEIDSMGDENKELHFDFNCEDSQDIRLTLDNSTEKNEQKVESVKGKLILLSSDDEIEEVVSPKKKKKNKKRKLDFSDDEASEIESDLKLSDEEPEKEFTTLTNVETVNFDSDENEVEYDENEEIITAKVAKNFFEAEAELSESEWGSADEDEKGLDDLEFEEGDAEQFNEKKLQSEIGRIHMRQILDEDNREVRLLQEMLLEDGELHGAGRERKFKWKNADAATWNETDQPKEDDEDAEEVESELQWRKMRHEREMFLEEQRKKAMESVDEVELLANDSQIMKLGKEALKKSLETSVLSKTTTSAETNTFSLLNKRSFRGSFLTRSENTLSRLAEMTKVSSKEVLAGTGAKNSRNFVFASVSKTEQVEEEGEEGQKKKRKATEGTPRVLKKMRIAENSPSVRVKKPPKPIFSQS